MQSNSARVLAGIAVVAVAVVLFVVLRGDDDGGSGNAGGASTTKSSGATGADGKGARAKGEPIATIVIRDGKPVDGVTQLAYDEGERVRFRVKSDVADEVHVHGYDIAKEVAAGGTVSFDFPATIEGVFEAELEERGEQILELTVNP
ncbi:MAG TPA: hypothetical protein VG898_03285 [Solirubrobacterales bacterium]|nr:hypothetical protein [Solirubrobacterales bacterium]